MNFNNDRCDNTNDPYRITNMISARIETSNPEEALQAY